MSTSGVDWFKRITDAVTALVVLIGFIIGLQQVGRFQESTDMAAWNAVSQQWLDLDKFFVNNSDFRKYFYNGEEIAQADPSYAKAMAIGDYVLDFVDNAIATSTNILANYPQSKTAIHPDEWKYYFEDTFFKSPIICKILKERAMGYNPNTRKIGQEACTRSGKWK